MPQITKYPRMEHKVLIGKSMENLPYIQTKNTGKKSNIFMKTNLPIRV